MREPTFVQPRMSETNEICLFVFNTILIDEEKSVTYCSSAYRNRIEPVLQPIDVWRSSLIISGPIKHC